MEDTRETQYNQSPNEFETASRLIRWIVIAVVVATFPTTSEQVYYVYYTAIAAVFYNTLRYLPSIHRHKLFSLPGLVIGIDTLFVCTLIALVGNISTPYTAFLFLMITSAAYWYRLAGVVAVVALEFALLVAASRLALFSTIEFDFAKNIIIILSALFTLGLLVVRLTKQDKTERDSFRALAKKNESESSHLMGLVNSLKSAIFVVDRSGRIIMHNGAAGELCGEVASMNGRSLHTMLNLHVRTDPDAKPIRLLSGRDENQHRRDLRTAGNGGPGLDLDITVTAVRLHDSQTTNYVIICEDITHELSLSEQQNEFISVASHELRTPIAIMEAALSVLTHTKETLPTATMQVLEQAHSNALLLSGIVKDLSIISEAKNDNIPVHLENISAAKIARQIAEDFTKSITQKGLQFSLHIEQGLPTVLSTERHIKEILQNYMTNAIKYSNEGTVELVVTAAKTGGVTFAVKDTGIGITPSAQKNLFNKFFRAEDPKIQRIGGTGLGLYLCRELANRLGAKVWCKSVFGKGSTFYLEVPPFSSLSKDREEVVRTEVASLVESI